MSDIVMSRIDDRLVHGQVITGWLGLRNANCIWIVDDDVASDQVMLDIFRFATPTGVRLEVYTVDQAAERLNCLNEGNERIILLAKRPNTFVRLVEKGFLPEDINFGAVSNKKGSKNVGPNCALSPEEMEDTEKLHRLGIRIWFQLVPMGSHKVYEWRNVRKKFGYK